MKFLFLALFLINSPVLSAHDPKCEAKKNTCLIPNGLFFLLAKYRFMDKMMRDEIRAHSIKILEIYLKESALVVPCQRDIRIISYLIRKSLYYLYKKPRARPAAPSSDLPINIQEALEKLDNSEVRYYLYRYFRSEKFYINSCLAAIFISCKYHGEKIISSANLVYIIDKIYPEYISTPEIINDEAIFLDTIDWKLSFLDDVDEKPVSPSN